MVYHQRFLKRLHIRQNMRKQDVLSELIMRRGTCFDHFPIPHKLEGTLVKGLEVVAERICQIETILIWHLNVICLSILLMLKT